MRLLRSTLTLEGTDFEFAVAVLEGIMPEKMAVSEESEKKALQLYFSSQEEKDTMLKAAIASLDRAGFPLEKIIFTDDIIEEREYLNKWQEYFKPGPAGRFFINYSFNRAPVPPAMKELIIDPGMAFGTGFHPTTSGCLKLMQELDFREQTVLDIGCGSGVLSLAAALSGAAQVTAVDSDPEAVAATENNVLLNGLQGKVITRLESFHGSGGYVADIIVANVEVGFFQKNLTAVAAVERSRDYIFSGILSSRSAEAEELFEGAGLKVQKKEVTDVWASYRLTR